MLASLEFVVVTFVLVSTGHSAPVYYHSSVYEDFVDVMKHLSNFGYLPRIDPERPEIISESKLTNALRDYQEYMGLEVTGKLDSNTKNQMGKLRCGVQDRNAAGPNGLSNLKLGGSRWSKTRLTYKISKYPSNFPRDDTDRTIRKAFDIWSGVTPLKFVRKNYGPVHIEIRFESGEHGDGEPFDGPGGTLAHAYYPLAKQWGGDAHFDDDECWTIDTPFGINLLQTVAHEIGHSLGLDHSSVKGALMFETIQPYQANFQLHEDDIKAIQILYPRDFNSNHPLLPQGQRHKYQYPSYPTYNL